MFISMRKNKNAFNTKTMLLIGFTWQIKGERHQIYLLISISSDKKVNFVAKIFTILVDILFLRFTVLNFFIL
jgi:hypothetical protein